MSVQATQKSTTAGITPTFNAGSSGGDSYQNTGNETLEFKNTNAAARVVTFVAQGPCNHGVLHNVTVTIPANTGNVVAGPFRDLARWNDVNGRVQMTYDVNPPTGLVLAVFAG